jgi:hypothetical protein
LVVVAIRLAHLFHHHIIIITGRTEQHKGKGWVYSDEEFHD